jgi:glycine/sarcosine/betaine reductase complex component A
VATGCPTGWRGRYPDGQTNGRVATILPERRSRHLPIDLRGKRIIAIGERDGLQGQAIIEAARSAGAEVVLQITQCFV